MFTVPDAPSSRAPLHEWHDYLRLLETQYASARGSSDAIAEAKGVIETFNEKTNDDLPKKKGAKFRPPYPEKRVYKKIYRESLEIATPRPVKSIHQA